MPKKYLNGSDVASFIKERQRGAIRGMSRPPKLLIICTNSTPVTESYLGIKQRYASEIGAVVELKASSASSVIADIRAANDSPDTDGIIVQLPLDDPDITEEVLNSVAPSKDVDGLGADSIFDPATPTAILWLLSAYNIAVETKKVLVIGQGRLVGAPLAQILSDSGVAVSIADDTTEDLSSLTIGAEIIVSAAGVPRLLTSDMIPANAVVIDAGTTTDNGEIVGDLTEEVRAREDVLITPLKGGVGPLTVAALFENLIRAAKE